MGGSFGSGTWIVDNPLVSTSRALLLLAFSAAAWHDINNGKQVRENDARDSTRARQLNDGRLNQVW
jgi:hypothetical protein